MWAVSREDDMALAAAGGADDALRPADTLRPKRRAARMMVGGSAIVLQGYRVPVAAVAGDGSRSIFRSLPHRA
jgi:hypothetical protein